MNNSPSSGTFVPMEEPSPFQMLARWRLLGVRSREQAVAPPPPPPSLAQRIQEHNARVQKAQQDAALPRRKKLATALSAVIRQKVVLELASAHAKPFPPFTVELPEIEDLKADDVLWVLHACESAHGFEVSTDLRVGRPASPGEKLVFKFVGGMARARVGMWVPFPNDPQRFQGTWYV